MKEILEDKKEQAIELYLQGFSWNDIAEQLKETRDRVRWWVRRSDKYVPNLHKRHKEAKDSHRKLEVKREQTINADGSMIIEDKLAFRSITDYDKIIEDLGLDPNLWEVVSARFSEWDALGNDGEKLYSSRVSVKPKKNDKAVDFEKALEFIKTIKPIEVDYKRYEGENNLVVPLFDLHFGNETIESYKPYLTNMLDRIRNGYKKIVFISGGDILNEDNYNGQTASGTVIGKTNMTVAWQDCFSFYCTLLNNALEYAKEVELVYIPGNHDTFSGHTVLLALEQFYSLTEGIKFDLKQEVYKSFLLDEVFIGCTHGHRANVKRYPMIMASMFPKLWGASNIRECFTGHLHNEWSSKDSEGIMIRQMPSRNKADDWHREMGFIASHKRFMLVEYNSKEIEALYYA